ncbi:hypothetical protein CEE37_09770 [candidate division LCP-89 bacterium B3_LCP]|uniref:Uncharacterized protein n=1 Tax=candidate division LCP-89 bacterium B3_LCP TaxID=2012998 RepID=A0A532UYH5_UNCL8|nr:MAG: hypothetical protein CEE37_09770 [candidate division LCP-89 bacterium B3_LCP]
MADKMKFKDMLILETKKIPKFKYIMEGLGYTLLIISFVIVLFISTLAILSGYGSLRLANDMVEQTCLQISDIINKTADVTGGKLTSADSTFIENSLHRLECNTKGLLDSSTIAFLFQLFTFILVSAGIYLLTQSQKNLRNAEKMARTTKKFVTTITASSAIEGYLTLTYHGSWKLRGETNAEIRGNVEDYLNELKASLDRLDKERMGIEFYQHKSFVDRVVDIRNNIKCMHSDNKEYCGGFEAIIESCHKILHDSGFVGRYDALRDALPDYPN